VPLWEVLEPQERVALLVHELAHVADAGARHLVLVRWADQALARWLGALSPGYARLPGRPAVGRLARTVRLVVAVLVLPLTVLARLTQKLLVAITVRDSHLSEYWADALSVELAGVEATVGALRRSAASSTYEWELLRAVVNGDPNPMGAAAATIRGLLDPEHAAAVQRELAAVRPAIVDDLGSDLHPS